VAFFRTRVADPAFRRQAGYRRWRAAFLDTLGVRRYKRADKSGAAFKRRLSHP
jgi:hypothetical protein